MNSLSVEHLVGHSLGTYHVEQLLGQSKMNAVYLARHSQHQTMVMLTVFLLPHEYSLQARERFRERFMQVAATITTLNHPCILPVHDFGEQGDYPYIVTPLIANTGSLAALLKQQARLTPTQALEIVQQVAAGLDYAHRQGVIHGALKSTNILLDSEQKVLIAGFGQATILQLRGIEEIPHPYMHLLSIARTFLGAPAYIAPEVVKGMPCAAPADVYALGAMLFEMLSGEPPFAGMGPLTTALQHVERPVPSLLISCSDLPLGLDLVVQQALKRDPAQRYRSAGELVHAFERVLRVIDVAQMPVPQTRSGEERKPFTPFPTLPPDYDWFAEEVVSDQQLEDVAVGSGMVESEEMKQISTPSVSKADINPQPLLQSQENIEIHVDSEQLDSPEEMSIDPFVWWSTTSLAAIQQPDTSQRHPDVPPATTLKSQPLRENLSRQPQGSRRRPPTDQGRRRAIAVLAIGGVAFLGALGIDGMMLAQRLQDVRAQAETSGSRQANAATARPTPTPTEPSDPTPTPTVQPSPTPTEQPSPTPIEQPRPAPTEPAGPIAAPTEPSDPTPTPTVQPSPTPTAQPSPTPTMQPSPTPTVQPSPTPGHTGTVIGATSQGTNSSKTFTNPADGKKSLLIHLSNGNFVAFESACPHDGATCYYDSGSQKIICPKHNAHFDPNNNAEVLQGPPKRPLPAVTVSVNADGTVTVS